MTDIMPYVNTIIVLLVMLGCGFGLGLIFHGLNKLRNRGKNQYEVE